MHRVEFYSSTRSPRLPEVPSFRQNESSRQETVSTDRIIVSMLSSVRHSAQHLSRLQTIPGPHFELKPLVCDVGIPSADDTTESLRIPPRSGFNRHREPTRLLASLLAKKIGLSLSTQGAPLLYRRYLYQTLSRPDSTLRGFQAKSYGR